jgi:hypothetical protein
VHVRCLGGLPSAWFAGLHRGDLVPLLTVSQGSLFRNSEHFRVSYGVWGVSLGEMWYRHDGRKPGQRASSFRWRLPQYS